MKARTYDQIQIEAKLIKCAKCKRSYYMTHRHRICQACRKGPK